MACKCSPCLVRLMAAFAARGHVNSGCCAGAAHTQANPKSDHEPDASGYAHAQDIHEKRDHDMQPFVDYVMAHPGLYPLVKYMILEGRMYYPRDGARRAGVYAYTGPNPHASHLHVSIHRGTQHWSGSWHVDAAYGAQPTPQPTIEEHDDMAKAFQYNDQLQVFTVDGPDLVQRWFDPTTGKWTRQQLATGVEAFAEVAVVRDYKAEKGRLDLFADGAQGGVVHAWYSAGKWANEVLT